MCPNPQETSDSVTFTEEILDWKLHFLCRKTFLPHRNESNNSYHIHCVKNVYIRSFSGLHFPAFGLNTERYGVSEHFHLVILQLAKFCKLQKLGTSIYMMELFAKIVNGLNPFTIFAKGLHCRCLTGSYKHLCYHIAQRTKISITDFFIFCALPVFLLKFSVVHSLLCPILTLMKSGRIDKFHSNKKMGQTFLLLHDWTLS